MKKKQPVKQTKSPARGTKKSPSKKTVKVGQIGGKSSRRFSKIHLLILVLVFAIIGAVYTFASHAATGDGSIGVYRLFQGAGNQHMFTTSEAETRSLVPAAGFSSEGFGFYAWTTGNDGRKPVYRLANGKHLFTMSEVEKNALVKGGWALEGVAFYAYDAPSAGRLPAYRLSYSNGDHLYTTSGFERDQLSKSGWSNEGVAFYVSDGASAPAQNTHIPSGVLDPSSCSTLVGWALDGDNLNTAVRVDAYIQGVGVATGPTNVARPDITQIFYAPGNHGYNITIPAKWRDGQAHGADVYAINVNSKGEVNGNNVRIGHREFACDAAGKDHMPEILAQRAAEAERQRKIAEAQAAAAAAAQQLAAAQAAAKAHADEVARSDAAAYATIFAYFHGGGASQQRSVPPPPPVDDASAFFAAIAAAQAQQAAAATRLAQLGLASQSPIGVFAAGGLAQNAITQFASAGLAQSNVGQFASAGVSQYNINQFANGGLAFNTRGDGDVGECIGWQKAWTPSGWYANNRGTMTRFQCLQKMLPWGGIDLANTDHVDFAGQTVWRHP